MSPLLPAGRVQMGAPCGPSASAFASTASPPSPSPAPASATTATTTTTSTGQKKRARKLTNSERGKLYRSRRKTYVSSLEEDVEQLKRQVDELQLRRATVRDAYDQVEQPQWSRMDLAGGSLSMSAVERIVHEYFSQFEFGIPLPRRGGGSRSVALALTDSMQAQFLNGVMHPDLLFAHLPRGVGALLEQWARYSTYHTVLQYELSRLEVVACDPLPVVHASATLRVRFSRTTIEKIFPHVLWNEPLVQRLIGLEVSYLVGNTFYFGEDRRIHRYDTWVDFVAAFVGVLGSIADSMQLLESANIRDEALLGELAEQEEADAASGHAAMEQVDSVVEQQRRAEMDHTRAAMSLRAIL